MLVLSSNTKTWWRIYDFGESNGRFFLVMEYIEGKTIGALISQTRAHTVADAPPGLGRQVALGLEHCALQGIDSS